MYAARCMPLDETVAVKIINLEQYGANIDEIRVCGSTAAAAWSGCEFEGASIRGRSLVDARAKLTCEPVMKSSASLVPSAICFEDNSRLNDLIGRSQCGSIGPLGDTDQIR